MEARSWAEPAGASSNALGDEVPWTIELIGSRWTRSQPQDRRRLAAWLAVAVAGHVLPLVLLLLAPVRLGEKQGDISGVAVEIIDAAELDRRLGLTGKGPDRADTTAPSEATVAAEPPAAPAAPAAPQAEPLAAETGAPAGGVPMTEADVAALLSGPLGREQAVADKRLDLDVKLPPIAKMDAVGRQGMPPISEAERYLQRRSRSGKVSRGEVDSFTREIASSIERVKPVSPGIGGRVTIEFVVSLAGRMEELRVTVSSGDARLDDLILRSVTRAQLAVPPPEATLRDRTFEITFKYR